MEEQKPSEGRVVHYVFEDERSHALVHRPAIIVNAWNNSLPGQGVNLAVIYDGTNDHTPRWPEADAMVGWQTSVYYSETPKHNTWHWPERS